MSKVSDLVMEANSTVDETFDNADWLYWFNGALGDLTPYLGLEGKTTITVALDEYDPSITHRSFALPENALKVTAVLDSNMSPVTPTTLVNSKSIAGWYMFDNFINFTDDYDLGTTFTVVYQRRPSTLASDSDVPEVPQEFQQLLVIYGCYKAQLKDDELERAQLFFLEYNSLKRSFIEFMKKIRPNKTYRNSAWQVIR